MTSVNSGYEARLRGLLKQGAQGVPSFGTTGLPTVGFDTSAATGILGKIAPYLIYALIITFVVMIILIIVHYAVTPIFNFGDNPDALISLTAPDWVKSWEDTKKTYIDQPTTGILPKNNFSIVFDANVKSIVPTTAVGNIFVMAYKVAGIDTSTLNNDPGNLTTEVTSDLGKKFKGRILNDFAFLDIPETPINPTEPSLVVVYNSIKGLLEVYYLVTNGVENNIRSVSCPISPKETIRVGIVVSDTRVELYVNGKYAASNIYPGKTLHGTDNDIFISVPSKYASNVAVGNCFQLGRVVSSGEIRSIGSPSTLSGDTTPTIANALTATVCAT